jgi:hypothetical protein
MHKHTRREFLPLLGSLTAVSNAQPFRYDLIVKADGSSIRRNPCPPAMLQ